MATRLMMSAASLAREELAAVSKAELDTATSTATHSVSVPSSTAATGSSTITATASMVRQQIGKQTVQSTSESFLTMSSGTGSILENSAVKEALSNTFQTGIEESLEQTLESHAMGLTNPAGPAA